MTTPVASPAALGTADIGDRSRLSSRANLEAAGQKFEAVFDNMMLKSMREAKLTDDDLMGSKALDTFQGMEDQQVSQLMAQHSPIGIGKAMVDFLSKSQKSLQAPTAPSADVSPAADSGDAAASIGGAS